MDKPPPPVETLARFVADNKEVKLIRFADESLAVISSDPHRVFRFPKEHLSRAKESFKQAMGGLLNMVMIPDPPPKTY